VTLVTSENRKLLKEFSVAAIRCAAVDPTKLNFERMRYTEGVLFDVSDDAISAQNALVNKVVKTLGPVRGHAAEIVSAAWSFAASVISAGAPEATAAQIDALLKDIEASSTLSVCHLKPCQNVRLVQNVRKVSIGPVSIRRSSFSLAWVRRACPMLKFTVGNVNTITSSGLNVTLPPTIWGVEVVAAEQNREQEVGWLVDVALSVLRLVANATDLGPLAPHIGQAEAHPFEPYVLEHSRITVGPETKYSFGGASAPRVYEVGRKAQRALSSERVKRHVSAVFSPPKNSLAERFAQGLGWMSRARQSTDRSTRLLYFFTAIEALLSASDEPIVQTVSRHAAAVLSDDNLKRSLIAKDIRDLYSLRSKLVHTGRRGVYNRDSNTIQYIAELLFQNVWDRIDLAMNHDSFVNTLSKASYGLRLRTVLT